MSVVDVLAPAPVDGVLTDDALAFVGALHERFEPRRRELLAARAQRRARIAAGEMLDFLPETRSVREGDWQVAPAPADYRDRRLQIPVRRVHLGGECGTAALLTPPGFSFGHGDQPPGEPGLV